MIKSYQNIIQFPLSFTDIFQNLNSNSFLNQNKTQILEKFINEIAHTDVINVSKAFLNFIEYDKYLNKFFKIKNMENSYDKHEFNFKEN